MAKATCVNQPRCPECGEPVFRQGTSEEGVARWAHRYPIRRRGRGKSLCNWNGIRPVGIDEVERLGIDQKKVAQVVRRIRDHKRLVITSAQNATPINEAFLKSLLSYCKHNDAQLVVIPYRYKNPTSMWSERAEGDDWWASELDDYLLDRRINLNDNLVLLADIKTQPTASRPLQGFETLTGKRSAIVGHPKIELTTVATPQAKMAKILTSTGSVTLKNYIPSKAGKKGEHHHTFGATVVELKGKKFFLRQINAVQDGSFIDLDHEYSGDERRQVTAAGLVMGDTHVGFTSPGVVKATFDGPDSMVGLLRPEYLVWHDLCDFYRRNHHHRGKFFTNYVKHHNRLDNVEAELNETFAFVDRWSPPWAKNVIVPSNHPDALGRWVEETDPRSDPENAVFWAQTFEAMCRGASWAPTGARTIDPFVFWARKKLECVDRTIFPERGGSFLINGIEVAYHGDKGINGSRANRLQYSRIGVKTVIGHSHSPGICDGVYQVGTSTLMGLSYQDGGPSSWLQAHCVIYANGKRSLLIIIGDEWRA